MEQKFGRWLALASFLALAGCAQNSGTRPSYIGLTDLAHGSEGTSFTSTQPETAWDATRYVQSNKVLGAMAFHRVTGRSVDPESLGRP
jgi:hypothetical protein